MSPEEMRAREKIYQAALELIKDGEDAERITTRQIAAKAGVNSALVNYYYRSKESLLAEVVGTMMDGLIRAVRQEGDERIDAGTRLKNMLTTTADTAFKYRNVCKIAIAAELKKGCRNSCEMVLPFLREIFPGLSEADLIVIALQLMLPFHHIILDPKLYGQFLGADFLDAGQRREKISHMVDCILPKRSREDEQ